MTDTDEESLHSDDLSPVLQTMTGSRGCQSGRKKAFSAKLRDADTDDNVQLLDLFSKWMLSIVTIILCIQNRGYRVVCYKPVVVTCIQL